MTREEAIKELERISEDTVQRDCSTCGRPTAGIYNGVCCYCSLCQVVPEIFKDYHERKHFRSYWKWNGRWKNEAIGMAISALSEHEERNNMVSCKHRWGKMCKKDDIPCAYSENCFEPEEPKLKTNADHIRSMTDEELGLFLGEWAERGLCWMCDGTGEVLYWLKEGYND